MITSSIVNWNYIGVTDPCGTCLTTVESKKYLHTVRHTLIFRYSRPLQTVGEHISKPNGHGKSSEGPNIINIPSFLQFQFQATVFTRNFLQATTPISSPKTIPLHTIQRERYISFESIVSAEL